MLTEINIDVNQFLMKNIILVYFTLLFTPQPPLDFTGFADRRFYPPHIQGK